jgi:hypothetical protein
MERIRLSDTGVYALEGRASHNLQLLHVASIIGRRLMIERANLAACCGTLQTSSMRRGLKLR